MRRLLMQPPLCAARMFVPTVDLSRADAADVLRRALHTSGFFYLAHDGVDDGVIEDMRAKSKAFFALDVNVKSRIDAAGSSRGWTRMRAETLDAAHSSAGDSKEGVYIGRECASEELEGDYATLVGRNKWLDETSEASIRGYRRAMERYYDTMVGIGMRLLTLVAAALDVEEDYFDTYWTPTHNCVLRPLRYAAVKSDANAGTFAAGAHSDYGGLTILKTLDDVPGLEIYDEANASWIAVPPRDDAFVVNIGDLLERWSNGRLKSTKHRVMTAGDVERHSVAFFFEPDYFAVVEPIVRDVDDVPKYDAIRFGDYLLARYAETYASADGS
jgi:isopenicillin N synthase-like dioxygenase